MVVAEDDFRRRADQKLPGEPSYVVAADSTDAGSIVVYIWQPGTKDRGGAAEYEIRRDEILRVEFKR